MSATAVKPIAILVNIGGFSMLVGNAPRRQETLKTLWRVPREMSHARDFAACADCRMPWCLLPAPELQPDLTPQRSRYRHPKEGHLTTWPSKAPPSNR